MEVSAYKTVRCCFCKRTDRNELLYGKFYKLKNITTHYYCLLLSAHSVQNGKDHEGILGFLLNDIIKEMKRGEEQECCYCKEKGATLECSHKRCGRVFHLPCGRQNHSLHQFFNQFRSFCDEHRPKQKIDAKVLADSRSTEFCCPICFDPVIQSSPQTLWAPCCRKESWFHWSCVQFCAFNAGYFFKCPLCNNEKEFKKAMQRMGIYVPQQDASWERQPNAYQSLYQRHGFCNAEVCCCPNGNNFFAEGTEWELRLCEACASQGMHVECGQLKRSRKWYCSLCFTVMEEHNATASAPKKTNYICYQGRKSNF